MSETQVTSFSTTIAQYHGDGNVYFAVYASEDIRWADRDETIPKGDPATNNSWAHIELCTLTTVGDAKKVTVPAFNLAVTEDSINPNATYVAYFLDDNKRVVGGSNAQPYGSPFRVFQLPAIISIGDLMRNTALNPPLVIDSGVTRTVGALQMYNATSGLIDSVLRQISGALSAAANFALTGAMTISGTLTTGALTALSLATGVINAVSAAFTGNVTVNGTVTTTGGFVGPGGGITGVLAVGTGGTSSTGSLSLVTDSDNTNAGEVQDEIFGSGGSLFLAARTSRLLKQSYVPLWAELHDKGGIYIDVKTRGAKGDGVTDDTAAINQAITDASAIGAGIFFPRSTGRYMSTGNHEPLSAMTIAGAGGGDSSHPFGDSGQPLAASVIELTADNVPLFKVGNHVNTVTFRDLSLTATTMTGTTAILFSGLAADGATFNIRFDNLYITAFDIGIDVEDEGGGWQADNAVVNDCIFYSNNIGVLLQSSNATNWRFTGRTKFNIPEDGYGVYAPKAMLVGFHGTQFIGDTLSPAAAAIYMGVQCGILTLTDTITEQIDLTIDTEDTVVTNTTNPITLIGNGINQIRLQHSREIVSIANKWLMGEDVVMNGSHALNVHVWSMGDVCYDAGTTAQINGSPWGALTGAGLVITQMDFYNNRIDASVSGGLTIKGHMGVGAAPAGTEAVLKVALKDSTEENADLPFIQALNAAQTIHWDVARDHTTGAIMYSASQATFGGHQLLGAKLGFYDDTKYVAQQTIAAAGSDAATTQTLANSIRTILLNLGLAKT